MITIAAAPSSFGAQVSAKKVAQTSIFWILILLRAFLLGTAVVAVGKLIEIGTAPELLALAGLAGTVTASLLAFTSLRTRGFVTTAVLFYVVYSFAFSIIEKVFAHITTARFASYVTELHVDLIVLLFAIGAGTSWLFWRYRHWLTIEILSIAAFGVYLVAGHRNYRFDTPRLINTLAWDFNVDELTVLVVCGSVLCIFLLIYLFVATLPGRPSPHAKYSAETQTARTNWLAWGGMLAVIGALFFFIAHSVYRYNVVAAGSRTANGVGESQAEGISPLGFHSALGATNQPSALVRLEGDYSNNPFSPMLYLREQALSEFNGHEMVAAERSYDEDVSNSSPVETFSADPDTTLGPRTGLRQSIYLLTEHKLAFAVDFPISINPLKNPNPSRFKAAYQAYSMAPAFQLGDLRGATVGDPRWNDTVREHYLQKHQDPRYQNLADSLTEGVTDPIEKIGKLVGYLNQNAIYTLTPNHDVKADEDPVAPFLFGDMRGYCVHFAHAMVYLLRAAGIPARIGTGYLTDLSESKDGNILLRMSDRHAWPEVYIEGKGWLPFDIQPQHVESHGETPVDQKLLEELMASLDPPEDELPKDVAKNEPGMQDQKPLWAYFIPSTPVLVALLLISGLLPFITKCFLWWGWALPGSPEKKTLRTYRSILSRLFDLGIRRFEGETRTEFEKRVQATLGREALALTTTINAMRYADTKRSWEISENTLAAQRQEAFNATKKKPWWHRLFAAVNPASTISFAIGRKF